MTKNCLVCNAEIDASFPKGRRKYCSSCLHKILMERCSDYNKKRSTKSGKFCNDCKKLISWKNKTGYCQNCLLTKHRDGSNCPSWKGGRRIDKDGYIFIYHPEPHPRRVTHAKNKHHRPTYYVAEHILNWEKYNGMPLPEGYTVHHLNGIKDDNRPKNLVALPTSRHSSGLVNEALQKRIRELEAIISQQKLL